MMKGISFYVEEENEEKRGKKPTIDLDRKSKLVKSDEKTDKTDKNEKANKPRET